MRYKPRQLTFLLVLIFILSSLCGCGNKTTTETTTKSEEAYTDRVAPEWINDAVVYEVNIRQYTKEGTFKAFSEHLERLHDMGVNTLWFMPIYPISEVKRQGSLGSYYSIADYKNVNPEFGDLDDFKELVEKAHDMGFHVMIDWVANHTGWDHVWISEHPQWYRTDKKGNIISPPGTDWYDVAQLDYKNEDMCNGMIDAMKFWVDEVDVDGFRCDYAGGVPSDFWNRAREELTEIKPVYMLAEDNMHNALLNYAFDSNYNWNLYDGMVTTAKDNISAYSLRDKIEAIEQMPEGTFPLNFMDNHDKNSWEGTIVENFGDSIEAFTALMFTIPGAPLLYSGQETGLDHALKFFDKDEIDWTDLKYSPLITDLAKIRSEHEALSNNYQTGSIKFVEQKNDNVLIYTRQTGDDKITVLINLSKEDQQIESYSVEEGSKLLLTNGDKTDELKFNELKAWTFYIFSDK